MKAGNDALRELLQIGPCQHGAQFRLADQDDLQQLALIRFQIGQQTQLLQHVGGEVLRFVDDEHVVLPDRMGAQQELVQRVDEILDRGRLRPLMRIRNAELFTDRLQQLGYRELGVEDVGDVAAFRELLQKAAAQGGLAGADVAGGARS